jgi:hypothetical protein
MDANQIGCKYYFVNQKKEEEEENGEKTSKERKIVKTKFGKVK